MKKTPIYWAIGVVALLLTSMTVFRQTTLTKKSVMAFYPLKTRPGVTAPSQEAKQVQEQFENLQRVVRSNPGDLKSRIALASLYIQEARVTGLHGYYDEAAIKYIEEVLSKDPDHFEGLTLKAMIRLSQHQFEDGLMLAEKARKINPDNAFVYGLLVDANVELGNYARAVDEAGKMISIRPDIRSYSRISYLREIHGDYRGAIDAMKLAVDAGVPGEESTEWSRVHLGKLYELMGDTVNAELQYQIAMDNRPAYPYALAGLARLAAKSKQFDKAISMYRQADSLIEDHAFAEGIAEVYEFAGQKFKADAIFHELISDLHHHSHDENGGHHHENLELAKLYLRSGEYDEALEHALDEYRVRPRNIDVNETLAWIYYQERDYKKALTHVELALKTNSSNPMLMYRATLITVKSGDKAGAGKFLQRMMNSGLSIPAELKQEMMTAIAML